MSEAIQAEFAKQPEVFRELIDRHRVQDIDDYMKTGGPIGERCESWHSLYRYRYVDSAQAIRRDLVATVHCRIIAQEANEDGTVQAVVAGRGRWGNSFLFRCPLRWLTSGKSKDVSRVASLVYCRGGAGTFIMPDFHAAFCRAVVQLSESGEPMPRPVEISQGEQSRGET